ncbi:unnamed protein product, partial [Urochloa humidicola]
KRRASAAVHAPSSRPVPSSRSSWVFRPVVSKRTLWHLLRLTAPASAEISAPLLIYGLISSFLLSGTLEPPLLHSELGIRSWRPSPEVCERPLLGRGLCLQRWGLGNGINHLRSASGRRWGAVR